jgi:hypothetical protein
MDYATRSATTCGHIAWPIGLAGHACPVMCADLVGSLLGILLPCSSVLPCRTPQQQPPRRHNHLGTPACGPHSAGQFKQLVCWEESGQPFVRPLLHRKNVVT